MGCLQLSYYEDLSGFTGVSRMKVVYVNPRLKAKKESDFSGVDYYPFGEKMPGRSAVGAGGEAMHGYQGQEKVGNGSKWYNFQLRMYNPSIGRWSTIDPYAQHYSPYLAMSNNPISYIDPDGGRDKCKCPENPYGTIHKGTEHRFDWLQETTLMDLEILEFKLDGLNDGSPGGGGGGGSKGDGTPPDFANESSGPSAGFGQRSLSINEWKDGMGNSNKRNILWGKNPYLARVLINQKNAESAAASKETMFKEAARVSRGLESRIEPNTKQNTIRPSDNFTFSDNQSNTNSSEFMANKIGNPLNKIPDFNVGGPPLASNGDEGFVYNFLKTTLSNGVNISNPFLLSESILSGISGGAVASSVYGNIDLLLGLGVEYSQEGKIDILQGVDAGKSAELDFDSGFGIGMDVGASVLFTKYYFTGENNQLDIHDFVGSRTSISGGASYFIEAGFGYSVAKLKGGYIIGVTKYVGVSPPGFSGNMNRGNTQLKYK